MSIEEIRKGAPRNANKYILFKDGTVLYLKAYDFFEYWNQSQWIQSGNSSHINFDLSMVGIFPL